MTFVKLVCLICMTLFLSYIYGKCINHSKSNDIIMNFITGFFLMISLLEITSVVFMCAKPSVDSLLYANVLVCMVVMVILCLCNFNKIRNWDIPKFNWWHFIMFAFIVAEGIFLIFYSVEPYGADAYSMNIATRAYETNILYSENPFTGAVQDSIEKKLLISPYILIVSGISRLIRVHPMSVFHTGFPMLIFAITGMIYYKLASLYTKDKRYCCLFTIILMIVNLLFTNYDMNASKGMLIASWHGKIIVANVCLPAVWYYATDAMMNHNKKAWSYLLMVMTASLFFSIIAVIFCPALLICILLYYSITEKNIKYWAYCLVMVCPAIIAFLVYAKL